MKLAKTLKNQNTIIAILTILLILSLSYIGYSEYTGFIARKTWEAAQAGYTRGVLDTVTRLYKESEKCEPVPVMLGNKTRYLIDISCLRTRTESGTGPAEQINQTYKWP
ncbi:MAG TPA: hypothetical protein ENG00_00070 [Candidatus Aenigmarchaeota archaeon]|nr:hypothetical protein [Candidatus Aenigmarchaeota archaeon]